MTHQQRYLLSLFLVPQWIVSQGPNGGKLYKNVAGNLYIGNSTNIHPNAWVHGGRVASAIEFIEQPTDKGNM